MSDGCRDSSRDNRPAQNAHLRLVWNTLMFFAHPDSYTMGERTGGVLAGCPRNPPPTRHEMSGYARRAAAALQRYIGREPEAWLESDAAFEPAPIDMILHCPHCKKQHIDAPETTWKEALEATGRTVPPEAEEAHKQKWTNPPHKSHLCHWCQTVWRPAAVPTNGVMHIEPGKNDTWPDTRAARALGTEL